jgi:hypothetical protein
MLRRAGGCLNYLPRGEKLAHEVLDLTDSDPELKPKLRVRENCGLQNPHWTSRGGG